MKKKLTIVLVISLLLISALAMVFYAVSVQEWEAIENGFAGGNGTEDDPYIIKTPEQLEHFREHYLTIMAPVDGNYRIAYYKLGADLTFNDETFTFNPDTGLVEVTDGKNLAYFGTGIPGTDEGDNTVFDETPSVKGTWYASKDATDVGEYKGELYSFDPIGHNKRAFAGMFDGGGHTISGLFIYDDQDMYNDIGFFATYDDGEFSNMNITNSLIYSEGSSLNVSVDIGAFAGEANYIRHLTSDAIVIGGNEIEGRIGGVAGFAINAKYCSFSGTVSGGNAVGGVVGASYQVTACRLNDGTVYGNDAVGGVVGKLQTYWNYQNEPYLSLSYAKGSVKGTLSVGGVIGHSYSENAKIQNCYNQATVSGETAVGGIAGQISSGNFIYTSYNAGKINAATSYCGALVGKNLGTLSQCYYAKNHASIANTYQNGIGAAAGTTAKDGSGTTVIQHSYSRDSYPGFNFDSIWCFDGAQYPSLQCHSVYYFPNGSGTKSDPYLVENQHQLWYIANNPDGSKDKYYKLTTDLILNDETFTFDADTGLVKITDGTHTAYVGTGYPGDNSGNNTVFDEKASVEFRMYASDKSTKEGSYNGDLNVWSSKGLFLGTLDGNGHTITGFYSESGGLFDVISMVYDLHINNALVVGKPVDGWNTYTGVFSKSVTHMSDCSSNAIVLSDGGITSGGGIIKRTTFSGTVISNNNEYYEDWGGVGGICSSASTIIECRNTGTVLGDENVGGIAGYSSGSVFNCINEGTVVATECYAAGIVANGENPKIYNSYNIGNVYSYHYAGGIVAYYNIEDSNGNPDDVQNCYYLKDTVHVKGQIRNQGIGGCYNYDDDTITATCPDTVGVTVMLTKEQMKKAESFAGFDFNEIYAMTAEAPYPVFLYEVTEFEQGEQLWNGSAANTFAGGSGTVKDPYLITTPAELKYFAEYIVRYNGLDNDKCFALGADIVLNDTSPAHWYMTAIAWEPMGTFAGIFDGRGYSICGLYIDASMDAALFTQNIGTIKNLTLKDSYITGLSYVGGIAVENNGTIENCHADIRLKADNTAGGIVGINQGTITRCSFGGDISGYSQLGGIVGINNGTIENCVMDGSIQAVGTIGGIVCVNNKTVLECTNNGAITGRGAAGGIVGNNQGTIRECNNKGFVYATNNAGGIAASNSMQDSVINHCQNDGDVTSRNQTGGIVGYSNATAPIENCQNNGNIIGKYNVGGIVGYASTSIENCQNYGDVSGISVIGGIVGEFERYLYIKNCVNYGNVYSTVHTAGGIAARSDSPIENCQNYGQIHGARYVGGIIGHATVLKINGFPESHGDVTLCQNFADVFGTNGVGGIAGYNQCVIQNCFNSGAITGTFDTGGIAGFNTQSILNCYNTGKITAEHRVGGVAGSCSGSITNCYNAGWVNGSYYVGSLIGELTGSATLSNSYYLYGCASDGTARQKAVGAQENGSFTEDSFENTAGITDDQFKDPTFLEGFDFTQVWMYEEGQNNGLPILRAFHTHVFDQKSTDEAYLKESATCQTPAVYYVSCACGQHGEDTFVGGKNGAHTLSDLQSDAACHFKKCTLCEGIFEHEAHVYDDVCDNICNVCNHKSAEKHVYDYKADDDDGHQITCIHCDHPKAAKMPHNYPDGKVTLTPTVDKEGEITFTCKECGHQAVDPIPKLKSEPEPEPSVDDKTEPESSENENEKEEVKNEQKNGEKNSTLYFLIGIGIGCIAVLICMLPFLLKKRKTE